MNEPLALRHYQEEALRGSYGKWGYAYYMEQRTGKTPTAVKDVERAFLDGTISAAIVICPKCIITDWVGIAEDRSGFAGWFAAPHLAVGWKAGRKKTDPVLVEIGGEFLRVFVVNYDAIVRDTSVAWKTVDEMLRKHKCAVIFDESQRIKTPTASRTKKALKIANRAAMVRILSGTPAAESPLNYWTQGTAIGIPGWQHSFFAFRNRYAVLKKMVRKDSIFYGLRGKLPTHLREILDAGLEARVTETPAEDWVYTAYKGLTRIDRETVKNLIEYVMKKTYTDVVEYQRIDELKALMEPYVFRITRKEAWPETPDKQYKKLYVDLGPKQKRAYEEFKQRMIMEMQGQLVTAQLAITKLLRLQQILGGFPRTEDGEVVVIPDNQRIDTLLDYLEDVDGKVIIFARFTPEVDAIVEALEGAGRHPVRFDGTTSDKDREAAKKAFQHGDATDFVANVRAGDVGLTLSAAQTTIYYNRDPSLEIRLQSEDRAVSKENKVLVVDMLAAGTVEVKTIEALRMKRDLAATITGDELLAWI